MFSICSYLDRHPVKFPDNSLFPRFNSLFGRLKFPVPRAGNSPGNISISAAFAGRVAAIFAKFPCLQGIPRASGAGAVILR
jgi:hypothetical protein